MIVWFLVLCLSDVIQGSCSNALLDGIESDVDCGGGTCAPCATGMACAVDADCAQSNCVAGNCTVPPPLFVSPGAPGLTCQSGDACGSLGIAVANVLVSGHVIHVAAGEYNVSMMVVYKPLTIRGAGPGATILNANYENGVFSVAVDEGSGPVRFEDLGIVSAGGSYKSSGGAFEIRNSRVEITNCHVSGSSVTSLLGSDAPGGAIYAKHSNVTLRNVVIRDATAQSGGAIYALNSTLYTDGLACEDCVAARDGGCAFLIDSNTTIRLGTMARNNAVGTGGALYVAGSSSRLGIVHSNISANNAGQGGAIWTSTACTLLNASLTANTAIEGGAIKFASKLNEPLILQDVVFVSNQAVLGGAIDLVGGALVAAGSQFVSNIAFSGGAARITNTRASSSIDGCVFIDNSASQEGGALMMQLLLPSSPPVHVSFSRFLGNIANGIGGGVSASGFAVVRLEHSIMTSNTAESGGALASRDSTTITLNNLTLDSNQGTSGGGVWAAEDATVFMASCVFTDSVATTYGGAVFGLGKAAWAIDSTLFRRCRATYGGGAISLDLETSMTVTSSVFTQNSATDGDGGAIVARSEVTVAISNSTFVGNGAIIGGALHLRDGSFVNVTSSVFRGNSALSVGGALQIQGAAFANLLGCTLSSNTARSGGAAASDVKAYLRLEGCHLHSHQTTENGGALFCSGLEGRMDLISCNVSYNRGNLGGGVMSDGCKLVLDSSVLSFNVAVRNGGAAYVPATTNITSTVIEGNVAMGSGGGLFVLSSGYIRPSAFAKNVVFRSNSAAGAGGALLYDSPTPISDPHCHNCVYEGNTADGYGNNFATRPYALVVVGGCPPAMPASDKYKCDVAVYDFFNASVLFSAGSGAEAMKIEMSAASGDLLVTGELVAAVVDGVASFKDIGVRGPASGKVYHINFDALSENSLNVSIVLNACEAGYSQDHPDDNAFSCTECLPGSYDVLRSGKCSPCPNGALCEGTTALYALKDYWRDPRDPKQTFYRCSRGTCCPGGRCTLGQPCAGGRLGTLCGQCADGLYEVAGKCIKCDDFQPAVFLIAVLVYGAIATTFYIGGTRLPAAFLITLDFMQTISFIIGPNAEWSALFELFVGNSDWLFNLSGNCPALYSPIVKASLPFAVMSSFVVLYCTVAGLAYILHRFAGITRISCVNRTRNVKAGLASVLRAMWPGMAATVVGLLACRKVGESWVLKLVPIVECQIGPHISAMSISIVVVLVILLPMFAYVPMSRVVLLRKYEHGKDRADAHLRDLWTDFDADRFWWSCVIMLRQLLLAVFFYTYYEQPLKRTMSIMVLLFVFAGLHVFFEPYISIYDDAAAAVSYALLIMISYFEHNDQRVVFLPTTHYVLEEVLLFVGSGTGVLYMTATVYALLWADKQQDEYEDEGAQVALTKFLLRNPDAYAYMDDSNHYSETFQYSDGDGKIGDLDIFQMFSFYSSTSKEHSITTDETTDASATSSLSGTISGADSASTISSNDSTTESASESIEEFHFSQEFLDGATHFDSFVESGFGYHPQAVPT